MKKILSLALVAMLAASVSAAPLGHDKCKKNCSKKECKKECAKQCDKSCDKQKA